MTLIRKYHVENNQQGRTGFEFQSPYTGSVYYATLEHKSIVLRDWPGTECGREDGVDIIGELSACFAYPGMVVATIAGFVIDSQGSDMWTYLIPVDSKMSLNSKANRGKPEENVPELSGKVAVIHVKADGSVVVREEKT